jgi:hypothetical protein
VVYRRPVKCKYKYPEKQGHHGTYPVPSLIFKAIRPADIIYPEPMLTVVHGGSVPNSTPPCLPECRDGERGRVRPDQRAPQWIG